MREREGFAHIEKGISLVVFFLFSNGSEKSCRRQILSIPFLHKLRFADPGLSYFFSLSGV